MLPDFKGFIQKKKLFAANQSILLAVSGGIDSIVMATLFWNAGFKFGIAHVNFGLRGKESDEDEVFVEKLAEKLNVPFFTVRYETKKFAVKNKVSIQMAARDLRYAWLEETRKSNKFHFIAVAHHLDDVTETMLINLLRGTGIAGLHGILPAQGKIIRPLLFASKNEIVSFAKENKLIWRNDSSNEKDDYTRNLIRHHVLPVFKRINPSYEKTFGQNAARLMEAEFIVNEYIENVETNLVHYKKEGVCKLPKVFFKEHPSARTILYELIKKFDFTAVVTDDIVRSINSTPGKKFFSTTHQLVLDREFLVVSPIKIKKGEIILKTHAHHLELTHDDFILKIHPLEISGKLYQQIIKNKDKNIAYADMKRVKFPITLRTWQNGDVFYPFGMKGKKKLSDFYTDLKLSLTEKERTWLLTDSEKIIWILGHRLDNRVALTGKTKFCYRFEFIAR